MQNKYFCVVKSSLKGHDNEIETLNVTEITRDINRDHLENQTLQSNYGLGLNPDRGLDPIFLQNIVRIQVFNKQNSKSSHLEKNQTSSP